MSVERPLAHYGNYFASSEDINDTSKYMLVGQLGCTFQIQDQWYGKTTRELFEWYPGESDASIIGKKLYQISVDGPNIQNYSKDRQTHRPTGLIFGVVDRVLNKDLVLIRCSDEWINSPSFLHTGRMSGQRCNNAPQRTSTPPPYGYEWAYSYNDVRAYDKHADGATDREMLESFPRRIFQRFAVPKQYMP